MVMILSCQKNGEQAQAITQISYGTSFGFCLGYCKKDICMKSGGIIYTRSGWVDTIKTITCTEPLSDENWNAYRSEINSAKFFELPETIGCPDCTDGGAEYLELIVSSGEIHKVTFEYMNEPDLLKDCIAQLRQQSEKSIQCDEN